MKPGDRVHHALKTKDHDDWTGIVLCVETHTETGTQTGRVGVRWISPTGAPNDGWNWHWPFELTLAKAAMGGEGA